jgi:hypothetical protein
VFRQTIGDATVRSAKLPPAHTIGNVSQWRVRAVRGVTDAPHNAHSFG